MNVCSPFQDKELAEFVFSLPREYVYYPDAPKHLLKKVLNGIVPEYILNAEKRGFTPPGEHIEQVLKKYGKSSFNTLLVSKICRNLTGEEL